MSQDGYRIPLHRSLTSPMMLGGAPRRFAILNATLAAAIGFGLQAYYCLPLFVVTHCVGVILAKQDPDFFDVLIRAIKKRAFYRV